MKAKKRERCPFCGEGNGLQVEAVGTNRDRCAARCTKCNAMGPRADRPDAAIKRWNRRGRVLRSRDDEPARVAL